MQLSVLLFRPLVSSFYFGTENCTAEHGNHANNHLGVRRIDRQTGIWTGFFPCLYSDISPVFTTSCSMSGFRTILHWETLKRRTHNLHLDVHVRILITCILQVLCVLVWTAFNWPRIGTRPQLRHFVIPPTPTPNPQMEWDRSRMFPSPLLSRHYWQ